MPPNNQYPQTPAPPSGNFDSSQFDFIMNPGGPQKKSLIPGGPKARMIVFSAIIALVLVLFLVVVLAIMNSGSSSTENLVTVARKQNEVIRVADIGVSSAGEEDTRKLATMTKLVVTSDQKKMIDYLATQKKKVSSKDLSVGANSKTDQELEAAESNGRFDEVFSQIILKLLKEYQQTLRIGYEGLGANGKQLIDASYENASLILEDNQQTQ